MNGWRLDNMLQKKDGTYDLETSEGFWFGEVGMQKAMNALGYRYNLRALPEEFKNNVEVAGYIWQLGPLKVRWGEAFGGTGNNAKLRDLKRKYAKGPLSPSQIEENEYWKKRYGHKRWWPSYVDQSQGQVPGNDKFLRGLGENSGYDPLREERFGGNGYVPNDWGNCWLKGQRTEDMRVLVTEEQIQAMRESGRVKSLPPPSPKK